MVIQFITSFVKGWNWPPLPENQDLSALLFGCPWSREVGDKAEQSCTCRPRHVLPGGALLPRERSFRTEWGLWQSNGREEAQSPAWL